jgi:hypothetical protein
MTQSEALPDALRLTKFPGHATMTARNLEVKMIFSIIILIVGIIFVMAGIASAVKSHKNYKRYQRICCSGKDKEKNMEIFYDYLFHALILAGMLIGGGTVTIIMAIMLIGKSIFHLG